MDNPVSHYGQQIIAILQSQIGKLGYTPVIHFELEGTYVASSGDPFKHGLDFDRANAELSRHHIQGVLKPEFWPCQWEWASRLEGQAPLKVAHDLQAAIRMIPHTLTKLGCSEVSIRPVTWNGASGRMIEGSRVIFAANQLPVHIPNSVQINISALDQNNQNAIPENRLGETLQECFMRTSYGCCLLYAPEEEAFKRLSLKKDFRLEQELSSPHDISGGHQGSIALYKEHGKHNQKIGEKIQLYDAHGDGVSVSHDWRPYSRVEHRLGSASLRYNAFANTVFALANLSDALMHIHGDFSHAAFLPAARESPAQLPASLYDKTTGAYDVFSAETWLENKINACAGASGSSMGTLFKNAVLDYYKAAA